MHFLQNYWKGYQDKQKPLSSLWATSVLFFFLSFFFSILKVVWVGRLLRQDTPLRRWPLAGIQVEDMEKLGVHGTFAMAETFPAKLSQGTWCQPRGSWQAWLAQQATSEARALPSPLPVKDRFPSLFYKSFNIAFVFEIMEKPQVKKAGIKNLSQTGCVHTAPS